MNAEKAAIPGRADEGAARVHYVRGKAGPVAGTAADAEYPVHRDAHTRAGNGDDEAALLPPERYAIGRSGGLAPQDAAGSIRFGHNAGVAAIQPLREKVGLLPQAHRLADIPGEHGSVVLRKQVAVIG